MFDAIGPIALLGVAAGYVAAIVVSFQKKKSVFGALGLMAFVPVFAPLVVWFPIVGALRLAKPDSSWAEKRYDEASMERAQLRFPPPPDPPGLSQAAPLPDAPPSPGPTSTVIDTTRPSAIAEFLDDARDAGLLDESTHRDLTEFSVGWIPLAPATPDIADTTPEPAAPPAADVARPDRGADERTAVEPVALEPTAEQVPAWSMAQSPTEQPTEEADSQPRPADVGPFIPAEPREPGPFAVWASRAWDAVAADVALHGFSYLGVLLTVIGVLGFLLFAFTDLPDATKPFVELFIASVFFGWAWALRRQQAVRVGQGMELIGGIVLPLVLFAGLVDDAPFPPDFEGGPLIVALVISALMLVAVYAWFSGRYPQSVLRYLVGPLVWLALMTLGFVFKTDEPLMSDAITRLVSAQPAMAAAGIPLTLLACRRWRFHRLAGPTVTAAVVGAPIAYLLTVGLAAGEAWQTTIPLVVLGVATFATAELASRWFDRTDWLPLARPLLLAGVLLPLAPSVDLGWLGLAAVVSYLALATVELAGDRSDNNSLLVTAAGVIAGALMTFAEPWAALVGFSLITIWAVDQRYRTDHAEPVDQALMLAGAIAPVGMAWAIIQLVGGAAGWLIIAVIVAMVAGWGRWTGREGMLWASWPSGSALVAAAGAIVVWADSGGTGLFASATLVVSAVTVAVGERFLLARLWISASLVLSAAVTALETLDVAFDDQAVVWAVLGLVAVVVGTLWHSPLAAHSASFGHLIALGALFFPAAGGRQVAVWMMWTTGWVVSTYAIERGRESVASLLDRIVARLTRAERPSAVGRWVPPSIAVVSLPPTVINSLNLLSEFRDQRSWTGISMAAIALLYSAGLRMGRPNRPLSVLLAAGAMVSSLIGVAVAAPDPWPSVIAAAAVIGVAVLLSGDVRSPAFVWIAWVMTFVLALLLGNRAGVGADSIHLVGLVWGALLMFGGLVLDDRRSGRRSPGEGVRQPWLRQPVVLGALAVPVSLGPVYLEAPQVYGWWSLGAAAAYVVTALLMRVGAVSAVGYALVSIAVVALSPWSLLERPWTLAVLAAVFALVSWSIGRSRPSDSDPWLRWDIAPLVVAHAVAAFALIYAAARGGLAGTAFGFALLSLGVAGWRRSWWWVDGANALVLLAALDIGGVWPAVALAATALRGAAVGALASGTRRLLNHAAGALSAGLGWLAFLSWLGLEAGTGVGWSAVAWGGFLVLVAAVWRTRRPPADVIWLWGGVGVLAMLLATENATVVGVEGPWLGFGYLLVAAAVELARPMLAPPFRLAGVPLTAAAWITLFVGWDIGADVMADVTAVVFGALAVGVVEGSRLLSMPDSGSESNLPTARTWFGLGAVGVVSAAAVVGLAGTSGWWQALGMALLALGFARGALPLAVAWLRDAAGVALLGASLLAAWAFGWSSTAQAATVIVIGAAATMLALWMRNRPAGEAWLRPTAALGVAADIAALAFALAAWPDRTLAVAVLLSVGVQLWAFGLVFDRGMVTALGPPLIGAGFLLVIEQSVSGSSQWYTVPLGLVVLAEVEIVRRLPAVQRPVSGTPLVAAEGIGLGLVAVPALVEMFTRHIGFGLVAFGGAGLCLVWGIVTRVRRRVIAAAAIATASAVLMIFAAAAGGAPSSAFWWIVAIGVGFSVMLVAALIEAFRSRKGQVMARMSDLMEGWE